MTHFTRTVDGELHVNIAGVLLLAAHEPTPKGLRALQGLLRAAKRNGCPLSTDIAESTLVSELARGGGASARAKQMATEIAKFIHASDVQEVLHD